MRGSMLLQGSVLLLFVLSQAVESAQAIRRGNMRGLLDSITGNGVNAESQHLVDASGSTANPIPLVAVWKAVEGHPHKSVMQPIDKIEGDEAIVIFHDRSVSPEAKAESAVVSFDVRSSVNCVVSVCGSKNNWLPWTDETCYDLRVASKSSNADENGVIRGFSAAYSSERPIAMKLYLKFDATTINDSPCQYEIISAQKTVVPSEVAATS